jgi:multisite-specific tRNA:(cytosine-C5)-methyltransferase
MKADFPAHNIFVRNPEGEAARTLYLSNDIVKSVIQHNNYERIRLTTAGTKVFSKQEGGKGTEAQFRVLGEGLQVVLPYVHTATILESDTTSLKILLESNYPLSTSFPEIFGKVIESQRGSFTFLRVPSSLLPTQRWVAIWFGSHKDRLGVECILARFLMTSYSQYGSPTCLYL